jgi:hypothetical protein
MVLQHRIDSLLNDAFMVKLFGVTLKKVVTGTVL